MNKRGKIVIFGTLLTFSLIMIAFAAVRLFRPKVSGLNINTTPASAVYVNGEQLGRTPYQATFKPGEVVIRLLPETGGEKKYEPYDTRLTLVSGVETVINYNFGNSDDESAGEIISFEKNSGNVTSLVVVSIPDFTTVILNGRERSTTPFKTSSIIPGEHELKVFADGYKERDIKVKTHEGYKLTLVVKLARDPNKKAATAPTPTPSISQPRDEVEILPNSVGYLRVRGTASTTGEEVGRVEPGKRYPYISTDPTTGWYQIEFQPIEGSNPAKSGWISNQYAKIVRAGTGQKIATPSASLTPTKTIVPTP